MRQLAVRLESDPRKVILLPFDVGGYARVMRLFDLVEGMTDFEVEQAVSEVSVGFAGRHRDLVTRLLEHYQMALTVARRDAPPSSDRQLLLGAYFSSEYSFQSTALFNPSIVPHPDPDGVPEGAVRFVMSLRAVGEGHVSSTVFRTGVVDADRAVSFDPPSALFARPHVVPNALYLRSLFLRKLGEMGVDTSIAGRLLSGVREEFTFADLDEAIERTKRSEGAALGVPAVISAMEWLARANYTLTLPADAQIADLVLYPRSVNESRGIEDMRLVRFVEPDGGTRYLGTYTGFDGQRILPLLMQTDDFRTISVHTLNGSCAQNKGMALFPNRIDGQYVMCSRIDGTNLYLMFSDNIHFWETARILARPSAPWEYRLMGNCGSPLLTPEGWLLLTHGVGPMRRYCIGAMLLDAADPFRVRGRLREPLIAPAGDDREGYVPNVVYSCGSMVVGDRLLVPYAVSDSATRLATVGLAELLDSLLRQGP